MKQSKTIIVNLYAGPGTGKSTAMAGIFSRLKLKGINCEMAPEFAKEKVWEESFKVLNNQIYVFGKQLHTVHRLLDKVDVVITDSPLLLSLIYGHKEIPEFKNFVLAVYNQFNNINYFLNRIKEFNPAGRMQNHEEAKELDQKILDMFRENGVEYKQHLSCEDTMDFIVDEIIEKLKEQNV